MMKKMILPLIAAVVLLSCSLSKKTATADRAVVSNSKFDVIRKDTTPKRLKPYSEIITSKAITKNGLIKVHKVDDRWFFEIADSVLNRDILIVNRISRAAASVRPQNALIGYGGDYIGENVVQFEKGPNQKLFIRRISYLEVSRDSSANGMYRSVLNSSLQTIVAAFDIKAYSPDSSHVVIDVTDYLNGDNDVFFFNPDMKKAYGLGGIQGDKSYIQCISSFPLNTEIKTVKTYTFTDRLLTYELNSSIVLLPAKPMRPRYADPRIGYFSRGYLNYDSRGGVESDFMITRWRLEPKDSDMEKYRRGELVEPKNPIVFYIDPATPKKWVPYLIQGVNVWQKAFEKAGFKNAIYALEAPTNDTTWSLEDARHNVIVYKASFVENASGPQISDPRSGEILESHINWYHNIQQLIHDWYFIQASPSDSNARKMIFSDSLMGRLIQYVCTHEVGHTLGLQHNFIASASVPVDSLRSKHYVAVNGHTPSIMDYARFNYVAQPEDGIDPKDLIPRIGVYDEWAIEWGYRFLPQLGFGDEEKSFMNKWIIERTTADKRLLFTSNMLDRRVEAEDLGDDPIKASRYGISNLKFVMSHLKDWASAPNDLYKDLERMNQNVIQQYKNYLEHVLSVVERAEWVPKSIEQQGPGITFPRKKELESAVQFFQEELFTRPDWLDNKKIFLLIGGSSVIESYQEFYMYNLLSPVTFTMLYLNGEYYEQNNPYRFNDLLTDMEGGIFSELKNIKPISSNRRYVQKTYVQTIYRNVRLQKAGLIGLMDYTTVCEAHIRSLYEQINSAIPKFKDKESRLHLMDLATRLNAAIDYQKKNFPYQDPLEIRRRSEQAFDIRDWNGSLLEQSSPFHKQLDRGCWSPLANNSIK